MKIIKSNKIIKIAICDNENYWLNDIKKRCEAALDSCSIKYKLFLFESGEMVLDNNDYIDLLFLDVELNINKSNMTGIDVLQRLINKRTVGKVVFVSNHEKYVWNAFSSVTLGYEKKPLSANAALKYIRLVLNENENNIMIQFSDNHRDTLINLSDLNYIEAKSNYIQVYTSNNNFIISGTLKYWEDKLKDLPLLRVHKSYIVNLRKIKNMSNNIVLEDLDICIPIGRKYKHDVKMLYSEYLINNARNIL